MYVWSLACIGVYGVWRKVADNGRKIDDYGIGRGCMAEG